jgi:ABC-type glutathione transport system ATPase component
MANQANPNPGSALRVYGLTKSYVRRERIGLKRHRIIAADAVSFDIAKGKTLALIGSSGSGKSTVARCISRLELPDEGEIWIGDQNLARFQPRDLGPFRSRLQMIFQDAATATNPRFSAEEVIAEPLLFQRDYKRNQRRETVQELMREVGLRPEWSGRRAHDFSGGQKQRLAIARALAVRPEILILDEALSGLDLATQAQIANLLLDLQASRSLTYLLISHDLKLIAHIADTIAVMSEGKIVEQGTAAHILTKASHEQTRRLVAASEGPALTRTAAAGGGL